MIRPLFIFLFVLLFSVGFIGVGSAESGSITVTDTVTKSWTSGGISTSAFDWDYFYLDMATYNSIEEHSIDLSGYGVFPLQSNATSFIITSGGTGTGFVEYNATSKIIQWYFFDVIITSSPFIVNYSSPILNGINTGATPYYGGVGNSYVSVSQPSCIGSLTATKCVSGNNAVGYPQIAKAATVSTITYNVVTTGNPINENQYNVGIVKYSGVQNKIFVQDSDNDNYFADSTFNTDSFGGLANNVDGVYINVTIATGGYESLKIINAVGATSPPEDNLIIGSGGAGVLWGASEYMINDVGRYYWEIEQDTWDETRLFVGYSFRALFYKRGEFVESLTLGSRVGNASYPMQVDGSYVVIINKHWNFYEYLNLGDGTDLATDSTIVRPEGDSWIMPPNNVGAGLPFNVTFSFGYSPSLDARYSSLISVDYLAPSGYANEKYYSILDQHAAISPDTEYNLTILVQKEGTYKVSLFDIDHEYTANATFQSSYVPLPVEVNLSTSYITTPKTTYAYGEIMAVDYGFDSINWSDTSYHKYVAFYNYDRGTYTSYKPLVKQLDILNAQLSGNDPEDCLSPGGCNFGETFTTLPGNNSVSLLIKNDTAEIELVHTNFTLSNMDSDGYGLYVSVHEVCIDTLFFITVYAPATSTLRISGAGEIFGTYTINATAGQVLPVHITKAGEYSITLVKADSTNIVSALSVDNCYDTADGGPPTITGNQRFLNLMSSNFLWVFMIFAVLMAAGGASLGGMGVVLGVALSTVISYGMDWIGNTELFIITIALIIVLAFGLSNRSTGN